MLMKKFLSVAVAAMLFVTGFAVYQTTATPELITEASSSSTSKASTSKAAGNQFGLSASMDASGNIVFGNSDSTITNQQGVWNKVLSVLQIAIQAIGGIGTSLMVLFFILNFIKLGQNSANANEVAKIKSAMLWNGIAAAGLGSVTLIFSLFFNLLK